ncbi:translation elongation factor Ts [Permianibacter aggregans]|uniref:Elongation factor Ts n=1 Tax=Permianibacter aggregans TaxID=1510150 RepID=A0A4R6UT92_9GAMM|nr:translation elongation factor Ts [Permianibacter aggregans]QGX38736.1 elongation factor Ts [Permianibacter aggregans]TDQ50538.1 elongation factor Ts [Permianibacter aggregans]
MEITAALVKELRERTGAGMMECKKALQEANGDIELAIDNMRKSGAVKAAKKAGRVAAEGVIMAKAGAGEVVLVEVNCETDFVAKDVNFTAFANEVADAALSSKVADVAALNDVKLASGETVETTRANLVAKIGENMTVRRMTRLTGATVASYIHSGRIGVAVALAGGDEELAKQLAMHIAAANPVVVNPEDISADLIAKERDIAAAQAAESGKPANIVEKMVEGRINKFKNEVSLVGQNFVMDPNTTVGNLLKSKGATCTGFIRWEVGEGIEKAEDNFAAEVEAMKAAAIGKN